MPDLRARILLGGEPVGGPADEFRAFLRAGTEKWEKVIRSAGPKAD